jgi:hypothetical protein
MDYRVNEFRSLLVAARLFADRLSCCCSYRTQYRDHPRNSFHSISARAGSSTEAARAILTGYSDAPVEAAVVETADATAPGIALGNVGPPGCFRPDAAGETDELAVRAVSELGHEVTGVPLGASCIRRSSTNRLPC